MSSSIGKNLKISIFGESHGRSIGVVVDGLPAGIPIDREDILLDMARRRAGRKPGSTKRVEADMPEIQSGVYEDHTTGTPLCAVIKNGDPHSQDYAALAGKPRPSHADYTSLVKYGGLQDLRGGGHFSGRLTAPLVFAGAVARAYLKTQGVACGSHIACIGGIWDAAFDPLNVDEKTLARLRKSDFPVLDAAQGREMAERIEEARMNKDSLGGIDECAVVGLPAGIGDPMFDGMESKIAAILFGVPGVKGVEFGRGFAMANLRGSEANDAMEMRDGKPAFLSNNSGGILGGITSGAPLIVRACFKPTASIAQEQSTVNMNTKEDCRIVIKGRHDSCITVRGLVAAEAAVMIAVADAMLEGSKRI